MVAEEIRNAQKVHAAMMDRHASSMPFLEPVIQYDWMAVFREPWSRPGA